MEVAINPGFCKELRELILPLTIIWSDIKLECICHCKEFALLFGIYCLSNVTPQVLNCLNKSWEFTGWYKTLQWAIFTSHSLGCRQATETAQLSSGNVDNKIQVFLLLKLNMIFLLFCLALACPRLERFHSQMHSPYVLKTFQITTFNLQYFISHYISTVITWKIYF